MRARDQLSDLLRRLGESATSKGPGRHPVANDGFFVESFADVLERLQAEGAHQEGAADELLAAEVSQIQAVMKARGLSIRGLAGKVSVSRSVLNRLFSAPSTGTRIGTLASIAAVLEVPLLGVDARELSSPVEQPAAEPAPPASAIHPSTPSATHVEKAPVSPNAEQAAPSTRSTTNTARPTPAAKVRPTPPSRNRSEPPKEPPQRVHIDSQAKPSDRPASKPDPAPSAESATDRSVADADAAGERAPKISHLDLLRQKYGLERQLQAMDAALAEAKSQLEAAKDQHASAPRSPSHATGTRSTEQTRHQERVATASYAVGTVASLAAAGVAGGSTKAAIGAGAVGALLCTGGHLARSQSPETARIARNIGAGLVITTGLTYAGRWAWQKYKARSDKSADAKEPGTPEQPDAEFGPDASSAGSMPVVEAAQREQHDQSADEVSIYSEQPGGEAAQQTPLERLAEALGIPEFAQVQSVTPDAAHSPQVEDQVEPPQRSFDELMRLLGMTTQDQEQVDTQPSTSEGLGLSATLEPAPPRDPPSRHTEVSAESNSDAASPLLAWLDQMN